MMFRLCLAALIALVMLFVPVAGERHAPPDRSCQWCHGTGRVEIPCPARHHHHNIHVVCGKCNGTGVAPTLEREE